MDRRTDVITIVLDETPPTWRYLCDDGQVVDVTGHDTSAGRGAALAHFERRTDRPKPEKKSTLWVRIEGSALVDPATVRVRSADGEDAS